MSHRSHCIIVFHRWSTNHRRAMSESVTIAALLIAFYPTCFAAQPFLTNYSARGKAVRNCTYVINSRLLGTAMAVADRLLGDCTIIIPSAVISYHLGLVDSASHENAATAGLMCSSPHGSELGPRAGNIDPSSRWLRRPDGVTRGTQ
ncbi:hypothetical protein EDB85DRAFT_976753 [Lactarius pseudohatsudake]|nr:hypothetical protein EDB85DRAFT_976753 [Lactarius pseudohatsudake]